MIKQTFLMLMLLSGYAFGAASSGDYSTENDSDNNGSNPVIVQPDGTQMNDVVLQMNAEHSDMYDDLNQFLPRNRHLPEDQRRRHVQEVLQELQAYSPEHPQRLGIALRHHETRNAMIRGDIPIEIERDDVTPMIHWVINKVITKDTEFLGHTLQREQKVKWITGGVSFVVATGLSALISYIGTLW